MNKPFVEIEHQISEAPPVCAIVRAQMLVDGPEELFPDVWVERFETPDGEHIQMLFFEADDAPDLIHMGRELEAAFEDAKNALKLASDEEKA
jgi:hypothetical protein